MRFWNFKNATDSEDIELRISGEIVDDESAWIYEWFGIAAASPNAFRDELNSYAGKNLTVWIDSWGGDTTAAAGIYNALKEHKGKVTVKIDGKAVSAASVIAMAGDEIKMSPVGVLMIHNPYPGNGVRGEAKDLRHAADILDVIKDTIMNAYQLKTGKSRSKISQMMDNETWMSAKTAKSEGFVDDILYSDNESEQTIENSFMLSRLAIQNSASASMRNFIEQYRKTMNNEEENEVGINSVEDLQREKPDLVNQVVQDAVKVERERIAALDALDDPQNLAINDLINDAKKTGKLAADIQPVVNIVKKHSGTLTAGAENAAGQQFLAGMISDNKASGVDEAKATGSGKQADNKQKDAAEISFMAGVINKKNGRANK